MVICEWGEMRRVRVSEIEFARVQSGRERVKWNADVDAICNLEEKEEERQRESKIKNWREAKEEEKSKSSMSSMRVNGYVQSNRMSVFVSLCLCERVIVGWSCIEQKRTRLTEKRRPDEKWIGLKKREESCMNTLGSEREIYVSQPTPTQQKEIPCLSFF